MRDEPFVYHEAQSQYRYYVCDRAQKRGWQACPSPSIPAGEIERLVIDEIKCIGRDPRLIQATLTEARRQAEQQIEHLRSERAGLSLCLRRDHAEQKDLATTARQGDPRIVNAHDRISDGERRVTEIDNELAVLDRDLVDEEEVAATLADFDALWGCLATREQARIIGLLVERVAYDAHAGSISITFRPAGIKTLLGELAKQKEEAA